MMRSFPVVMTSFRSLPVLMTSLPVDRTLRPLAATKNTSDIERNDVIPSTTDVTSNIADDASGRCNEEYERFRAK